jgi:17beta-estradiol 17-dehydrogenase / very-long-chain 3-oxoacyl-CoA reductase
VDELKAMGSVSKFRVVIADFTNSMTDASIFTAIYEGVKDLDIGLLVNNVGVISVKPLQNMKIGPLLELSKKEITDMISINCYPVVLMTRRLLPLMLRRKGKSAIINVSSITTTTPLPYYSVYSSTKVLISISSRSSTTISAEPWLTSIGARSISSR